MRVIALLGRRDHPTDGVVDYCNFLGEAQARRGIQLELAQVPWAERGWPRALRRLSHESASWRGEWVLLQYTALSWSRRGFAVGALRALRRVKKHGARCVVVFHDAFTFDSPRLRDRIRQKIQNRTMRKLFEESERSVLTVAPETLSWLPADHHRATFIPIGANIPEYREPRTYDARQSPKIIAVFSVTGGDARAQEVSDIAVAARRAQMAAGPVLLDVFGRGAEDARDSLQRALEGSGVELRVRGVIPAAEITATLASAHVSLCVRGLTTSHRGTSIAGISCGLPVVGYGRPGDDPAIDAAGVRLAPWHDADALAAELVRVLTDEQLWRELHERCRRAQAEYFSWDAVASRYEKLLATAEKPR
ncbi:MAG: glycosyltransferase family 4 protein [Candidatus Acidiferrales bacterium]